MRYRGQSYEIETPLEAAWITAGDQAAITAAFHAKHAEIYGHADDKAAVQIVALRVVIAGRTPKPALPAREMTKTHVTASRRLTVTYRGADIAAGLFERHELPPGSRFDGPAVVIQDDTTTWAPPGFTGEVDAYANLILRRSGMGRSSMT
jgi:N-methylhydantoinase A